MKNLSNFLNSKNLSSILKKDIKILQNIFKANEFDSKNLLKLFGKEVTRHINIDIREVNYLRNQVLFDKPNLLLLSDLFLLSKGVSKENILRLLGKNIYLVLKKIGILNENKKMVTSNIFFTPIANKIFINDGDKFNNQKYHVIQIVMEQPYLIKAVKAFSNFLLNKNKGSVLDLCTGSGVIGQSIIPKNWNLLGVDINPRALNYARFNLKINNLKGKYKLLDVTKAKLKKKYDIILANPPYNALVPIKSVVSDLTLHSGIHGDAVPNSCAKIVKNNLAKNGMYFMCGIILLKNNRPADKTLLDLSKTGTLIILHKAISDINTWEGMRLLYNCTPDFQKIAKGQFNKIATQNDSFNQVTWAIVIYKNNGIAKLKNIYNHSTDAVLISKEAEKKCLSALNKH